MTPADLDSTLRRPARFWNIDGLPLIGMGLFWLLWGGFTLLSIAAARHRTFESRILVQYGWLIVVAAGFAINPLVKRIKARVTEPRAGHIRVRRQNRRAIQILAGAIAFVVACGTAFALAYAQKHGWIAFERFVPAAVGLVIGVGFFFASRQYSMPSYAWTGLIALLGGIVESALTASLDSFGWFWLALGAACVVFGAIDLHAFLKQHPVASPEEIA
jgi:hypothetical protein